MGSQAVNNFVAQQGFQEEGADANKERYASLSIQPRIVGLIAVVGLVSQWAPLFLALSALLWWNVILPRWNPFDAFHNRVLAPRLRRRPLPVAPPPRRFAQGMAASFMLGIGVCLLVGWTVTGWVLQGFLVIALSALSFGRLCLGSYVYHLLRGELEFANRTLPWSRSS